MRNFRKVFWRFMELNVFNEGNNWDKDIGNVIIKKVIDVGKEIVS